MRVKLIKMKKILFTILLIVFIFNGFALIKQNPSAKKRPNIIFIYSDDQRYDALGINDNNVIITPELDKMAQQGIRFTNANVVFSLCSPSRAALLTGRYGSANGVLHLDSDLNSDEKTVAQYLKEEDYFTGISGKWHIGRKPEKAGFDWTVYFKGNNTYYGRTIFDQGKELKPGEHCDLYCSNRSVDFIREAVKKDQPFFLFHNTQTPHMNGNLIWDARVETTKKYDVSEMHVAESRLDDLVGKPEHLQTVRNRTKAKDYGYPAAEAIQQHTLEYYSVITEMDQFLGRIFHVIAELGLSKNTYIFFMGDNGWMLGEHGFTSKVLPYRPSSRVPFFVVGPGIIPSVNNQIVLNIDMAPTILELAGIAEQPNIHGKSIVPIFRGDLENWRKSFVYEGLGTYGGAKPNLTVIDKNYRYIVTYEDEKLDEIIFRELYDQKNDPEEMNNLVNEVTGQKIIDKMHQTINKHRKEILNL